MTAIFWDSADSRFYEFGVDRCVFYPKGGLGVVWDGITSVNETAENVGSTVVYIDGERRENQLELGDFSATVEAFTYPEEFELFDGFNEPIFSGQNRPMFDFVYRTRHTEEGVVSEHDYNLHLVYNCVATPTIRSNLTLNSSVDLQDFSWKFSTVPIAFPYNRPTAHIFIDSTLVTSDILTAVENILYGAAGIDPHMPTIDEILAIFEINAVFIVTINPDHTVTITGPDSWVKQDVVDPDKWTLTSPSVQPIGPYSYQASTY